jgi:excisionase family DNA binding protein
MQQVLDKPITRNTPADELPEYLSPHEVSAWLGIGRSVTYELIRTGRLPSVRWGRQIRIPRKAVVGELQ